MDNIRSRLAKGTFWISVTSAVTNLLGLVSTIVLARLPKQPTSGLVAIANDTDDIHLGGCNRFVAV